MAHISLYKTYWSSQKVLVCLSSPFFPCFLRRCLGAREMSQQLKACTPPSEDPSLIFNRTLGSLQLPRTSSLPGNLTASPGLCGHLCMWHVCVSTQVQILNDSWKAPYEIYGLLLVLKKTFIETLNNLSLNLFLSFVFIIFNFVYVCVGMWVWVQEPSDARASGALNKQEVLLTTKQPP